jgi:hypothetical protein
MSSIPETNKTILYGQHHVEIFINLINVCFRNNFQSIAQDDILANGEWGFDLTCFKPRIDNWHMEIDVIGQFMGLYI